jgi:hypothetical protein
MNEWMWVGGARWLVDLLWWGETDVSELWPVRAFCSSLGDLRCGPWMMILTEANSQLVYKSTLAAPSTGWFPVNRDFSGTLQYCLVSCHPRHLWSEWEVGEGKWEFSLSVPVVLQRSFTYHKILWHGTSGFTSHLKEIVLWIFIALKNPSP